MKRIACLVVALALSGVSSAVAGPIRDSLQQPPAATPAPAAPDAKPKKMVRKNDDLYWGGVVMAGIGGGLLGWGIGIGEPTLTCAGVGSFVSCQETGANRAAFIGIGAATMGAGIVLGAIGGHKIEVAATRRGGVSLMHTTKF